VTAGLANDLDEVAQDADLPCHRRRRQIAVPVLASANTTRTSPAVVTTSPSHKCGARPHLDRATSTLEPAAPSGSDKVQTFCRWPAG
jgi:hypothetical protein